jgi:hypothetical protein
MAGKRNVSGTELNMIPDLRSEGNGPREQGGRKVAAQRREVSAAPYRLSSHYSSVRRGPNPMRFFSFLCAFASLREILFLVFASLRAERVNWDKDYGNWYK